MQREATFVGDHTMKSFTCTFVLPN